MNPDAIPRCVNGMPASAGAAVTVPEHERVAALQSHDARAVRGVLHHECIDPRLIVTRTHAAADECLARPPREPQDARIDQGVMQHDVGVTQPIDRLDREEIRIARPCADQRNKTCRHAHALAARSS
jgi:hypothetical protein